MERPGGPNNPRYIEMHGKPPLWFAIENKQYEMVKLLLNAGASTENTDYD